MLVRIAYTFGIENPPWTAQSICINRSVVARRRDTSLCLRCSRVAFPKLGYRPSVYIEAVARIQIPSVWASPYILTDACLFPRLLQRAMGKTFKPFG